MAVVFLALNGVGLGHLVRATTVCDALAQTGERPVVFSQGIFPLDERSEHPGKVVPSLWGTDEPVRRRVSGEIASMAALSLPAVLIEDTHPNPLTLPQEIRRALVVRPTTFAYLQDLNDHYSSVYSSFVLCDAAGSPTWPYSESETRVLSQWPQWGQVGPVYRRASEADADEVRRRHGIDGERRLCVFSMGGGGLHRSTDPDAVEFARLAGEVADAILAVDPSARLMFVRGPYFPDGVELDPRLEVVDQEPRMPALLSLAHAAVVRSGFNTIWECVAGGVPFLPFVGSTFAEPNDERLARLRAEGLLCDDPQRLWWDEDWRASFRERCRAITARNPGRPDAARLRTLLVGERRRVRVRPPRPAPVRGRSALRTPRRRRPARAGSPLAIRVDDVAVPELTLGWLLRILAERRLRASLDVVPYLNELNEASLAPFDPGGDLFEVAQHGYAHVPHSDAAGRRHEFAPDSERPAPDEVRLIRRGRAELLAAFPDRFGGGLSPPFDALPLWLADVWHGAGGLFVSHLFDRSLPPVPIPVVRAGTDIWDWDRARPRPHQAILEAIEADRARHGHAGIVLHPRCLRRRSAQEHLVTLLDALAARGFYGASLRELALASTRGGI
ncbi:MAG TPA: hypothetical protein VF517_02780 [Thermoleophilaceae bacterium]|jgi:peptidoglycan/xylan/chitin deacetylase (PgdA/CDA1 family)